MTTINNSIKKNNYVRMREIQKEVSDFIHDYGINKFPFSISNLINEMVNVHIQETDILRNGMDALTVKDNNTFYILYTENGIFNYSRVRFSLCHELGHIVLGHFDNLSDGILFINSNILEHEADEFAGNLLAPRSIISSEDSAKSISDKLQISIQCANVRLNKIRQLSNIQITKARDDIMNYEKIDVLNGIAETCPICKNSNENGYLFCNICGSYLKNSCVGNSIQDFGNYFNIDPTEFIKKIHFIDENNYLDLKPCKNGEVLNGDCRFCPFCGSITTFALQNFLPSYEQEIDAKKEEAEQDGLPSFMNDL